MTKAGAKALSIEVWTYLAEHPWGYADAPEYRAEAARKIVRMIEAWEVEE
jgi:hypothetical protein